MGYALADAARRRGARVILVSGPTSLTAPDGVEFVPVRTAAEMHRTVREKLAETTAVIMAAAVADFRPAKPQAEKIKRGAGKVTLELESTPDILADISRENAAAAGSQVQNRRIIIGFAAETNDVAASARKKLVSKNADLIVANDVTEPGAGFDGDTNVVTLFSRDSEEVRLSKMSKFDVAGRVLDELVRLRSAVSVKAAVRR
jgi:phosphopantothenoylcysteine decarboxylase/phosphopantothenate--cysteine ligase